MSVNKITAQEIRERQFEVKVKPRLFVCSASAPKEGKTDWGLTGPPPVTVLDIDGGIHRPWRRFAGKKEIRVHQYDQEYFKMRVNGSADSVMKLANDMLEQIELDFVYALANSRTVIVDGAFQLYEIVRLAEFGRLEKAGKAREYGPVNRKMTWFASTARSSDANVIFTHRMADEYMNDQKTGKLVIHGWKDMPYETDMTILHWVKPKTPIPQRYCLTIERCGLEPSLDGQEFSNLDLPKIGLLVHPNSADSDWY